MADPFQLDPQPQANSAALAGSLVKAPVAPLATEATWPGAQAEAEANARAAGIPMPEQDQNSSMAVLRQGLASLPVPEGPSVIGMLRDTMGHLMNLMEGGRGEKQVTAADALSVAGPGGVAGRFYPVGSLGVFGSRLAPESKAYLGITEAVNSLPNDLEKMSPSTVLHKTGLSKDYNGEWVYEIDDSSAFLHPRTPELQRRIANGTAALPEVLHHPDLYEAFPYLKSVMLNPIEAGSKTTGGYTHNLKIISVDFNRSQDEIMDTILHETQHAVNAQEVDYGANRSLGEAFDNDYLFKSVNQLYDVYERITNKGMLNTQQRESFNDLLRRLNNLTEFYRANPGEVEARNTSFRKRLSEFERRFIAPHITEDVPRSDQVDLDPFRDVHAQGQDLGIFSAPKGINEGITE